MYHNVNGHLILAQILKLESGISRTLYRAGTAVLSVENRETMQRIRVGQ